MIEVQITDTATVSADGLSVTGPVHFFAQSVTLGGVPKTQGYVLVTSGGFSEVAPFTAVQTELVPFFVCALIFAGMFLGTLWGSRVS